MPASNGQVTGRGVWLFILASLLGAAIAAGFYQVLGRAPIIISIQRAESATRKEQLEKLR